MNLLVFGATGATGRLVVTAALDAGHTVTAYVRDPRRLLEARSRVRVIQGDAMDQVAVAAALPGQEAVICALGTMPEGNDAKDRRQPGIPVCSEGTRHILAAMTSSGCRRLVLESSAAVGDSYSTGAFGAGWVVRMALKQVMIDKEIQERLTRESATNWTIVRPVKLTNAREKGGLKSAPDLRWNIASTATRADVARYAVKILDDASTYRSAITVKN